MLYTVIQLFPLLRTFFKSSLPSLSAKAESYSVSHLKYHLLQKSPDSPTIILDIFFGNYLIIRMFSSLTYKFHGRRYRLSYLLFYH